MGREEFKKKIGQKLNELNLDREQVVLFAWFCGVRALPFLGSRGDFNFWNYKDRLKHIYSVLYALDVSVYTGAIAAYDSTDRVAAVNAAANTAAGYAAGYAAAKAGCAAAKVGYDGAFENTYTYTYPYPATSSTVAAIATAAYAADAAAANNMNLESKILRDLYAIRDKAEHKYQRKPSDLYGNVCGNFLKALNAEGCAYWGRLYENIFESGFVLDQEALERRLNVPLEIKEQGAGAVANYLEELEKGATRLNEARIIILGDKGSGKTCLARRLIDPKAPMTKDDESTAGVDTTLWKLEQEDGDINVRIWDFAGHTVTHAVHQFFLSERCLYIMVYDGRTEDRNRLEYWLNHMKNYGGDSRAVILVNKRDQHSPEIPINLLKEKYPIAGVYTFSIKNDLAGLEAFRSEVAGYIKNNPSWEKQEIPESYYRVKNELEKLFEKEEKDKGVEHITRKKFDEIALKHKVKDADKLLKDLHFLGISLWYREMEEFNTLVLNPEWISHGVYRIINWVNEEKRHSLTLDDFVAVFKWDENRYPNDKHNFLFSLMKHYELAYEAEEGDMIIPHLLKKDRPEALPDFPIGESLMLRYKADQPLPPNTVSRFIVRHNQEIKKEKRSNLVWRCGVVLEDGKGSIALVRGEDRAISVSVRGDDKTNYLNSLRATLNDIFNSYKSEKPELQYRIERFGQLPDEIEEKNPIWLPDTKILNHHLREKLYYDDATDQDISLARTVNMYKIEATNVITGGQGHQIMRNVFNFNNCNISLQGNLNGLAQLLLENGHKEVAEELTNVAKDLEKVEEITDEKKVKKSGITGRLGRLLNNLNNKESSLGKAVKGVKDGVSIAQDIAQGYNGIAQWLGLPQVPKPFLK